MKKHRKIQKKQETELYVQVAEKPENQKENVGEALACFCIYVGWYLMVMHSVQPLWLFRSRQS